MPGGTSEAYLKHFPKELPATLPAVVWVSPSPPTPGSAVVIFQYTEHTHLLGSTALKVPEKLIQDPFWKLGGFSEAFGSPPTDFSGLQQALHLPSFSPAPGSLLRGQSKDCMNHGKGVLREVKAIADTPCPARLLSSYPRGPP